MPFVVLMIGAVQWKPTFHRVRLQGNLRFIDSTAVLQIVGKVDSIKPFELEQIEKKLETLEPVKEAHLFVAYDSTLVIRIQEHVPIARIITANGESYYLTQEGTIFPVTRVSRPVYVPVVFLPRDVSTFGELIPELTVLIKHLQDNDFVYSTIAHLTYSSTEGWILISRIDRQKVIIGRSNGDIEHKINKLEKFHKFLKEHGLWGKYRTIDLRYKNQLVAGK